MFEDSELRSSFDELRPSDPVFDPVGVKDPPFADPALLDVRRSPVLALYGWALVLTFGPSLNVLVSTFAASFNNFLNVIPRHYKSTSTKGPPEWITRTIRHKTTNPRTQDLETQASR